MRKLVLLAAAAIIALGVIAIGAVLLSTDGSGPGPGAQAPGAPGPAPVVPMPSVPAPGTGPLPPASAAPSMPPPVVLPPGVRPLHLPPARVAAQLTPALAPCFEGSPALGEEPTTLLVELEAQGDGILTVVATSIRTRGDASQALVDCAQRHLRGQRVTLGTHEVGKRFVTEFGIEAPRPPVLPPRDLPPGQAPKPAVGRGNVGG